MRFLHLVTMENYQRGFLLKDLLENEGIKIIIKNEAMATIYNPGLQIEIDVPEDQYEKARQILKESFPDLGY